MSQKTIFQKGIPHLIACVIFLVISMVYFSGQLAGKVEKTGDIEAARANLQEILKYNKETGEPTLWTNSIFGGMPTYQIYGSQHRNLVKYVERISQLYIKRPIGFFFASMLLFYIMLVLLGVDRWLSIVGAIAFGLTTNNFVLYGAGHISKIQSIIQFTLLTAGIILAFRKKYLLGGLIFALGLALNLYSNHVQMTYYYFLTLLLYGLFELGWHIKDKEMASFGKSVLYLGVAGVIAIGSSAGKLLPSYEYGQDTMRGAAILAVDSNGPKTSSQMDGLEYRYATAWSNGWSDLIAGFIPNAFGGGSAKGGDRGNINDKLAYWGGNSEGTAGPAYYGAIVFFLFIFGMIVVKGPVKWWLVLGSLLISLISLGKNFPLHQWMFDIVPMFNKFRTPNSALSVVAFMIPILGFLGLNDVLKGKISKEAAMRALYISGGIMLSVCLFFAVAGGSFFDFSYVRDQSYVSNYGANFNLAALKKVRADMMSADSWRSFALILIAAGLIWAFLKEKVNKTILIAALGVLIFGDLWMVNKDYVTESLFIKAKAAKIEAEPRPVDAKILTDVDPHYRVFDISGGFNAAINSSPPTTKTSTFHKNIAGYHPAKLQRYQDILDRHLGPESNQLITVLQNAKSLADIEGSLGNLRAFNMLNTKYFIANNDTPIPNKSALGNVWFVDFYKMVNTPNEEIDGVRGINPAETAIVHNEFSNELSGLNIQKNGTIRLKTYTPNHITYESNTTSDQLAIFSEVWYGPDKGWNAYVDGTEVDHIRANYVLRGMKVPAGQHTIEFKFEPSSYSIGSTLTLICSLLIVLGLIAYIGYYLKQEMDKPEEVVRRAKVKPGTSSKKEGIQPTKSRTKTKGKKKKK